MSEVQLELNLVVGDKFERRREYLKTAKLHYSDRIINKLESLGWEVSEDRKLLAKVVKASSKHVGDIGLVERIPTIEISKNGRYFTIHQGFDVAFDIDGREFDFKPNAAAMLLNNFVENMYN